MIIIKNFITLLTYISRLSTSSKKYIPEYTTVYLLDNITLVLGNSGTKVNVIRSLVVYCFIAAYEVHFKKRYIKDKNY